MVNNSDAITFLVTYFQYLGYNLVRLFMKYCCNEQEMSQSLSYNIVALTHCLKLVLILYHNKSLYRSHFLMLEFLFLLARVGFNLKKCLLRKFMQIGKLDTVTARCEKASFNSFKRKRFTCFVR